VSLRVACVGGGPGGLLTATLLRRRRPDTQVVVFERNSPTDTFGFGVVFSDATLDRIHQADPVLLDALRQHGVRWDEIEARLRGERLRCGGNGMSAIRRVTLLGLLQQHALDAGVDLRFGTEVRDLAELDGFDVVVASDGANSLVRREHADDFGPDVEIATAKFIWFATTYAFDGLTFVHEKGPHGVFAAHAYPIGDGISTFIVETDEPTWRRAALDAFDVSQPPGPSDEKTRAYLEQLFAEQIDGAPLLTNNSRWASFRTLRTASWRSGRYVLLGDAAHTAHFSVGSGTKMALEDAVALAEALVRTPDDVPGALERYEAERRPGVERIQGSARPSLSWWEHFGRYYDALPPIQFMFHFLSRSISRGKLARRDPGFVDAVDSWWAQTYGAAPLRTPLDVAGRTLPGRRAELATSAGRAELRCGAEAIPVAVDGAAPLAGSAVLVPAPDAEAGLAEAADALDRAMAAGAVLAVLRGGTPLTRVLLAEHARFQAGIPAALVEDCDDDAAETLVLSGRTDLVARESVA